MTDVDVINRKIRTLIRTLLSLPENSVRKANTNAPTNAKTEPFVTVLVASINSVGSDEKRYLPINDSSQITSKVIGQRVISASIQFYRAGAYNNALRLVSLLSSDSAIEKMQEAGIGLLNISNVTNVAQVINTEWEDQAKLSIDFSVIVTEEETLNTFGSVEVDIYGEYAGEMSNSTIKLDV